MGTTDAAAGEIRATGGSTAVRATTAVKIEPIPFAAEALVLLVGIEAFLVLEVVVLVVVLELVVRLELVLFLEVLAELFLGVVELVLAELVVGVGRFALELVLVLAVARAVPAVVSRGCPESFEVREELEGPRAQIVLEDVNTGR
ncbi:MAG: hypothetical protein ACAI25_05255 [Planctomycetota bacterium]